MSLESNINILIGSTIQSINNRTILGDSTDESPLILLSILVKSYMYCLDQYNAGVTEYLDKLKIIRRKIDDLKNECDNICNYRDTVIIPTRNTAPTIDDNVINLQIDNNYQALSYADVIHNYVDVQGNPVSQIVILSETSNSDLVLNSTPVVINALYPNGINFTHKVESGTNIFLIANDTNTPCNPTIIMVNESALSLLSSGFRVANIDLVGNTITFQVVVSGVITNNILPITNLGAAISTNFTLKVKDNHPFNSLFSNVATITVNYSSVCENVPDCDGGVVTNIDTAHRVTYVLAITDFTSDITVTQIKLTSMTATGDLEFRGNKITSADLPLVISRADIIAGQLAYIPDNTIQPTYTFPLGYQLAFDEAINFCLNENIININKLANTNPFPTVVTESKTIVLSLVGPKPYTFPPESTTIATTATYLGTGGSNLLWTQLSGATDVIMANPTQEDLQLSNLKEGVYTFNIAITTVTDGFVANAVSTITVVKQNKVPDVVPGTGIPISLPVTTTGITGASVENEDDETLTIAWTQVSGPATATIVDGNTLDPIFNNLTVAGDYVFLLTATDEQQQVGSAEVEVYVGEAVIEAIPIEVGIGGCDTTPEYWNTLYIPGGATLETNTVIYTNNQLTNPFNGFDQNYRIRYINEEMLDSRYIININGTIALISSCTLDAVIIEAPTHSECESCMVVQVNVPSGQTREVFIEKSGQAEYSNISSCEADLVVVQDMLETISATKTYALGLNANSGSENAQSSITLAVTGGNSVSLERSHQTPTSTC